MSLLTSWDEPDDGPRGLGEAVVSSMFDVTEEPGEDVMDDAFLQEAILEHAKFLGMDPQHDKAFLWIAEEVRSIPCPGIFATGALIVAVLLSVCCEPASYSHVFYCLCPPLLPRCTH